MTDPYAAAFAAIARGQSRAGADRVCALASQAVVAGRIDEAERALRRAHALAPSHAGVVARLAGLAQLRGDVASAQTLAAQALQLDPGEPMAATMRVDHLIGEGHAASAATIAEAALSRVPEAPHLRRALAQAWLYQGRAHEAHAQAMRAVQALPNNPVALATACMTALYDDTLSVDALTRLHRELGARFIAEPPVTGLVGRRASTPSHLMSVAALHEKAGPEALLPNSVASLDTAKDSTRDVPRTPTSKPILRIGFVSADLRAHPMGWFVEPLFTHLPRNGFACFAYARVDKPDAMTERLRRTGTQWRDTHTLGDAQTHALIAADRIDVLIDLGGITHGARPRLFAGRAAPLQLSWLGYPYTSGLRGIDAIVGDAHVFPPGTDAQYRERQLRLPRTLLGMLPPDDAPDLAPLPATTGAPFTFGSFNHLAKLSDRTIALWSQVLHAAPASRLALSAVALGEAATRELTQRRFGAHGIAPERLLFLPPRPRLRDFLAHYAQVDLALDPLPFNGGTTSVHALWQGVTTLTLPGDALMNRMGLSIAHAAGLHDELVATDAPDFVRRAAKFAQRIDDLATLRATMRERVRATPLFDAAAFAEDFAAMLLSARPG